MTNKLHFGQIVLLKFPFTGGRGFKKRPALVIRDCDDGDVLVCRITSQIFESETDVYVEDWEEVGLKLPSVIRIHKLATLEKKIVDAILGKVDVSTINQVKTIFSNLPQ